MNQMKELVQLKSNGEKKKRNLKVVLFSCFPSVLELG